MLVQYVVGLPTIYSPKFPDVCVWCNGENPKSSVRCSHELSTWIAILIWREENKHTVRAPACIRCAWLNLGYRVLSGLIGLGAAVALFYFLTPVVRPYVDKAWLIYVQLVIILPAIVPCALADVLLPRAMDVTVRKEGIDYEFSSLKYCMAFCAENLDAPWCAMGSCKGRLDE